MPIERSPAKSFLSFWVHVVLYSAAPFPPSHRRLSPLFSVYIDPLSLFHLCDTHAVDYTAYTGNFPEIALTLSRDLRVERESLQKDGVTFCFERTGDYVYCVVADKDYGR